jgi:uncharacterized protein (DUF885 family)
MQGMTDLQGGRVGTEAEWRIVASRVGAIEAYLDVASRNLASGVAQGNPPDWRMLERNGVTMARENAVYFGKALLEQARARTQGQPFQSTMLAALAAASKRAQRAFNQFAQKNQRLLAKIGKVDHFAMGTEEYNWALRNNLQLQDSADKLYEESWPVVQRTRGTILALAERLAKGHELPWNAANPEASTRGLINAIASEHPKSDAEMIAHFQQVAFKMVEYARKHQLFDVPADYKLDVQLTPPALDAVSDTFAYYPAPPFRGNGVGRVYVTPTHDDPAALARSVYAELASLAAHEGFPGHDWQFKVFAANRRNVSPVRWFTPGEVEGSASMWEDSLPCEGWALYAEALMAEPKPGAPDGFYTPEEHLYQLNMQLLRDLRVRVDIGIHTGKMSYDEAVDLMSKTLDYLPGSCKDAGLTREKRASCTAYERTVFRYSKWPTQAITYRLGKERIIAMAGEAARIWPGAEGRKQFHLLVMQQGTIPPDLTRAEIMAALRKKAPPQAAGAQ